MNRRPDSPVEFFLDRCLGKLVVAGLRNEGLTVHSMAEVFGELPGQNLKDEEWLAEAGGRGWAVLTKDARIRRRPLEIAAVRTAGVRMFCLTNAQLTGDQQLERFIVNQHRMVQAARKPGPFIYSVQANRLKLLWPS